MMDAKLCAALLCALLLLHSGSADHESSHPPAVSPINPTVPAPSHNNTATTSSSTVTSSSTSSADGQKVSLAPKSKKDNDMNVNTTTAEAAPERDIVESTSQPPKSLSGNHTSTTSYSPLTSSTTGPALIAHTAPAATSAAAATPHTNTSTNTTTHATLQPPDSVTPSPNASVTLAPTPEPPKAAPTTASTTTKSSSTASTASSQEPPKTESQTATPPQNASRKKHVTTSSAARPTTTTTTSSPSNPSAQAKGQQDNPSQLNVGGDTTMSHDSPTLDPLLAGLVSAFIITAVIITLLLFLKLRRRDNRPEFRRLQDLPMDDMMEDTPLSMYSY